MYLSTALHFVGVCYTLRVEQSDIIIFMEHTILILQASIAVLLIVSILLQSRGEGLGVLGADIGGSYHTKRGFERFLLYASIFLSVAFIGVAIIAVRIGA